MAVRAVVVLGVAIDRQLGDDIVTWRLPILGVDTSFVQKSHHARPKKNFMGNFTAARIKSNVL
jgi:hypothetical protein